uniref:Uncharacterized protein n=1 Tax=Anguilla anguilla TaxID=7936 RepID=A0A0E9TL25_ANGAN
MFSFYAYMVWLRSDLHILEFLIYF